MCYTYTREKSKGKPVVRRGRKAIPTFPYFAEKEVGTPAFAKGETSGQGPSYSEGQPVTATECVSFELKQETYPSETRMDFFWVPSFSKGPKNPLRFDSTGFSRANQ